MANDENMANDEFYLQRAVELAEIHSADGNCGPFGAVIVESGTIIAEGWNQVVSSADPSAHAEVVAIREACKTLNSYSLEGAVLYSSCEPCPMCFSAAVWSRVDRVVYAESRKGAAAAGFDDEVLYQALQDTSKQTLLKVSHLPLDSATRVFEKWKDNPNKQDY